MKRIIAAILLLCLALGAMASCGASKNADEATSDTTIPVTSPDGFDDVTAPPEDDKKETEKNSAEADTTTDNIINDAEEAIEAARKWLGESDPDTGYKYAFSYDGSMVENNVPLFRIRVSWYIEEQERYSLCGYLLVSPYGEITKYSW